METVEATSNWVVWTLSFVQNWGSLIVSALSLLFALISLSQSSKAQKLQNKVNEIELKLKQYELEKVKKEEAEANSACVQARIIKMGNDNFRMKVWNSGGKKAFNVTAQFEGDPSIMIMDDEKMPFDELDPMSSFELVLLVHFGSERKARVLTEWSDADGKHHSKSQMVDI